ncbi:MAG: DNA internalization-related competence protein ComEC/Rec2 [Alysiella sp.]|uniref:DNA internalization-related competence protein ComEC/Rec2 n=1 Tax=Alysiella sp. TaxID=1872483 RepID=UPI0026DC971F|nr:DNA internalization-related competence protein ComEC/Rec2 [Alysiella sp.]MDO4433661.1 DNA internalization-related competence protein ComEC/Rec2 [Alysiella sp.]
MFSSFYLATFCVGVMLSFYLPERGTGWFWLGLLGISIIVYSGSLKRWGNTPQTRTLLAIVLCVSGMIYGVARTSWDLSQQWTVTDETPAQSVSISVIGLPEYDERGRVRFTATLHTADGRRFRVQAQDFLGRAWQVGSHWQVKARVRAAIGTRNRVGFDREAWALANDFDGMATIGADREKLPESVETAANFWDYPRILANRIRERIQQNWQTVFMSYPQGTALMRALAIGDGSGLSMTAWAAFRPLGINHLISISGLHITMMGMLAGILCKQVMRFLPRLPARPRVWQLAFGVCVAAVYTALAGFEIPALRSLLMLTVFAVFWAWRGRIGSWQTWWTALLVVLLYRPASVLTAGFWLSFGLVAVLLWVFAWRLPETQVNGFVKIQVAMRAQWAAFLLGSVAAVHFFGLWAVFAPLVNTIAIPFFTLVLVPLALLASFVPVDFVQTFSAWLGEQSMMVLLYWGERLPEITMAHAPAPLLGAAVVAALLCLLPVGLRVQPLAGLMLLLFAFYRPPPFSGSLKMTVWDVGQGLSVLLETPSQRVLFDTGMPVAESALLPNLRAIGVQHFHALILSHHDNDHDGGFSDLSHRHTWDNLWAGQPEFYADAKHCTNGTAWTIDDVHFEFLTPPIDFTRQQGTDNDLSCVLRVQFGEQAVLLTGDLGERGEQWLWQHYGDSLHSQVLVLGHHGSASSSSGRFINAVAPQYGIASSGFANPYRHPHPTVQTRLRAHGVSLLRTDKQGGLILQFDGQKQIDVFKLAEKKWWHKKPFD